MKIGIDSSSPRLTAIDSRGLPVRQIAYWRQAAETEARITLQQHDAAGWCVSLMGEANLLAMASAQPASSLAAPALSRAGSRPQV
ncbi:hypothetical protein [Pseudomonas sp. NPDC087615]|uniref:hypothetical protein n=1 Tax=Pseudomonas sp. NPDC087615 TaxID=3364443 RepID=UPI003822DD7C